MGDGPEASIVCDLKIAAVIQGDGGALQSGARPDELACPPAPCNQPLLAIELELLAFEAAGVGKVGGYGILEMGIRCVVGVDGQLNRVEFIESAQEVGADGSGAAQGPDETTTLRTDIVFLCGDELRELALARLEKVIELGKRDFASAVGVEGISCLKIL